jgi:hypothetical protein
MRHYHLKKNSLLLHNCSIYFYSILRQVYRNFRSAKVSIAVACRSKTHFQRNLSPDFSELPINNLNSKNSFRLNKKKLFCHYSLSQNLHWILKLFGRPIAHYCRKLALKGLMRIPMKNLLAYRR